LGHERTTARLQEGTKERQNDGKKKPEMGIREDEKKGRVVVSFEK
jgi:hypothetical protein